MKPDVVGVSKNNGTPKSSILIGFSIINHPFWGTPILGNTHLEKPTNFDRGDHKRRLASWLEMKKLETSGYPAPELECLAWVSQVLSKKETKQQQNCLGVFFDFGCDQRDKNM